MAHVPRVDYYVLYSMYFKLNVISMLLYSVVMMLNPSQWIMFCYRKGNANSAHEAYIATRLGHGMND